LFSDKSVDVAAVVTNPRPAKGVPKKPFATVTSTPETTIRIRSQLFTIDMFRVQVEKARSSLQIETFISEPHRCCYAFSQKTKTRNEIDVSAMVMVCDYVLRVNSVTSVMDFLSSLGICSLDITFRILFHFIVLTVRSKFSVLEEYPNSNRWQSTIWNTVQWTIRYSHLDHGSLAIKRTANIFAFPKIIQVVAKSCQAFLFPFSERESLFLLATSCWLRG
jgi:hypothetical protein